MGLRVTRRWGPARIGYHLGLNPSTVHKVLQRYRCPRLKWTDPATGTRMKTSRADKHSYEHAAPGDLVHVDVKKLGRIPDGGGWRFQDRRPADRTSSANRPGTRSSTTRSMTTLDSSTPRSTPTRRRRPRSGSGNARAPGSPAAASPSEPC